jgi:hypothetical protein
MCFFEGLHPIGCQFHIPYTHRPVSPYTVHASSPSRCCRSLRFVGKKKEIIKLALVADGVYRFLIFFAFLKLKETGSQVAVVAAAATAADGELLRH